MILRLPQLSGVPVYLQLMEQLRHAVETGALREGDQLLTIRKVASDLVVNPNTVARGILGAGARGNPRVEARHGSVSSRNRQADERAWQQCPRPGAWSH